MSKYYTGQEHLKKKSRDAARSRRGQQNDEYSELASQLPLSPKEASQLDRLSVMRLANSFIKIKHFLKNIDKDLLNCIVKEEFDSNCIEKQLLQALDGFVFVIGGDGHCLYISNNVSTYLGLMPIEVTGNSFYKFIHPCDHEEVAKELGGKIPLEDMEIFDGLFCSDSVFLMSNNLKGGSASNEDERLPYRSFFVRMKSTLTSRGKSVNLKASTYRVVHCMGTLSRTGNTDDGKKSRPLCFVGIGVPLMFTPTFEVPLDRCTFTSHHALDLKFIYCEDGIQDVLGYSASDVIGQSLYIFHHGCDSDVLTNCHKTLLTKGQCVSGYYRLLAKYGGWVWIQTKASIVYASKTCQPQFVLCIHYAISCVENGDNILSVDQLRAIKERQYSPTNSPSGKTSSATFIRKVCATQQLDSYECSSEITGVETSQLDGNSDVDAAYLSNVNRGVVSEDEGSEYTASTVLSPDRSAMVSREGSEAPTPSQDTSFYDNAVEDSPDKFAPFIPPPFGDTPFLVDSIGITPFDEEMEDGEAMWDTDMWEIYDGPEAPVCGKKDADVRRNLSTPKLFPVDELPILSSEEIEMSTPVQNLPLLQGNEIWFALDQNKEVVA